MRVLQVPLLRWLLVMSVLGACEPAAAPPEPEPGVGTIARPIVGGVIETGWPGVGALTMTHPLGGYSGSFCSGSLIAPRWVLTAAHCVTGDAYLTPFNVSFMTGTDANPDGSGGPKAGTLHASDSFHVSPSYDPVSYANDLALVHLAADVPGATVYPFNTDFLDAVGQTARYVGFGAVEGIDDTGGGIKRSADMALTWVYDDAITADFVSAGPCRGDSGGPVFLQLDGAQRIIGVHSGVAACDPDTDPSCSQDPCRRTSIETRVDVHATWIAGVINAPLPSCTAQPSRCACPAACQPNGLCTNDACQVADCETTYGCLVACGDDATCQSGCYAAATDAARAELDAVVNCGDDHCASAPDFPTCMEQQCANEVAACFPIGTGPASCRQVYDCLVACPGADLDCPLACYETGTSAAQAQYDALADCLEMNCGTLAGDAFQTCATAQCADEIDTCLPVRTGAASCEEVNACMEACGADQDCLYACYETGTAAAQLAYDALATCAETQCGALADAAFAECILDRCRAPYDGCFPPANCAVTGGDCPDGEACFPLDDATTDCFPSNGKLIGASCSISTAELDCGDGALCVDDGGGGDCTRMCRLDVDCGPGFYCEPLSADLDTVGTCAAEPVEPVEPVELVEPGPEAEAEVGEDVAEVAEEIAEPDDVAEVVEPDVADSDDGPDDTAEDTATPDAAEATVDASTPDASPDTAIDTDDGVDTFADTSTPDTVEPTDALADTATPDTATADTSAPVDGNADLFPDIGPETAPQAKSGSDGCGGGPASGGLLVGLGLLALVRVSRRGRRRRARAAVTGSGRWS